MGTPNWDFWIELGIVEAWKACALSLNIEPDTVTYRDYQLSPLLSTELNNSFNKRGRLLESRIIYDIKILGRTPYGGPLTDIIRLEDFATWAKKRNWEIPAELMARAQDTLSSTDAAINNISDDIFPEENFACPTDEGEPTTKISDLGLLEKIPLLSLSTSTHKIRKNMLDVPIDKAIAQAGSLSTSAVFLELREMALNCEKPFTGFIDGKALCYTNDNNEPDRLTKNGLDHRLRVYRNSQIAASKRG